MGFPSDAQESEPSQTLKGPRGYTGQPQLHGNAISHREMNSCVNSSAQRTEIFRVKAEGSGYPSLLMQVCLF